MDRISNNAQRYLLQAIVEAARDSGAKSVDIENLDQVLVTRDKILEQEGRRIVLTNRDS